MLRTIGAATFVAAVCFAGAAGAQDASPTNWSGFYIGVGVGISGLDADVDLNGSVEKIKSRECRSVDGYSKYGRCRSRRPRSQFFDFSAASGLVGDASFLGTIVGGVDLEVTPGIVIGAFIDADFSNADATFDLSATGVRTGKGRKCRGKRCSSMSLSGTGTLSQDYMFTIGGRIGVLSPDRQTLAYLLGGYSHLKLDESSVQIGLEHAKDSHAFTEQLSDDYHGFTIGGGAETKLTENVSLRIEYRFTRLDAESHSFSNMLTSEKAGPVFNKGKGCYKNSACQQFDVAKVNTQGTLTIDPEIHSVRVALSYKFNTFGF